MRYLIKSVTGLSLIIILSWLNPACGQKSNILTDTYSIKVKTVAKELKYPWGMTFLPDGRLLVTERSGNLYILNKDSTLSKPLSGTPKVFAKGQGGLMDLALHPNFAQNQYVYLSFAEPGPNGTASTALGRGRLEGMAIKDFTVIYSQKPKVEGPNHFGNRIVFSPEGYIYLALGERFKFDPAQDLSNSLGTIIRIKDDGSVPDDNPFVNQKNAEPTIWSYGHRNIESAAIDPATGNLWVAEMGPMGGDEFNQPQRGKNYGWPVVSWGKNYDGTDIPNPPTRPEFADAAIHWTPTISPSGLIFYTGTMFPEWQGSALIGGLTASGIVRVQVDGQKANEVERLPLAVRVRDVEQAPDGSIYVLTDEDNGKILQLINMEGMKK
jgi:glucose/arabinose dehydrogenase